MNLVLIGYMGSGKTAVGKALAATLDYPFIDLDEFIEQSESTTIRELFSNKGEIYFRRKESESMSSLLNIYDMSVIATGGGTPCYGNTMGLLLNSEKTTTIYLKTSVDELTKRLFSERSTRPLIAHLTNEADLTDFIRKHLFERAPVYERSEHVISVEKKSVSEIVEQIVLNLF